MAIKRKLAGLCRRQTGWNYFSFCNVLFEAGEEDRVKEVGEMDEKRWIELVEKQKAYKENTLIPVINFLKEQEEDLTYEKAEKILLDAVDLLRQTSKRQKI